MTSITVRDIKYKPFNIVLYIKSYRTMTGFTTTRQKSINYVISALRLMIFPTSQLLVRI